MLEITVFPPAFNEISASPFTVKAWCLMEHSGQPYNVKITPDPRKAPKGKLPVLRHDGKIIPDSEQIRDYMEQSFGVDYDAGLSAKERGLSRSIIRMMDEHMYFIVMASRWQQDAHWPTTRAVLFGSMPALLRKIIPNKIRKRAIQTLIGQGMGRHSPAEQVDRAEKDIAAIEAILDDQTFLFGDKPTAADYSVVPMLRMITSFPIDNPLKDLVQSRPTLMAYLARSKETFYPG